MAIIVTDKGFTTDDFASPVRPLAEIDQVQDGEGVEIGPADDPRALVGVLGQVGLIRVRFPAFNDGRGFSHARDLRSFGYTGRLRAVGHVLADQYAMARRVGFDEVEIDESLGARQPEDQWLARANWRDNWYQARLRA
ncbi:Oxidoreductase probably involved in sulfite reduction [Rubellimicrobium mesophilum DSM 19309]|uniref:Oxidoreductase probably involved in sulfite reduction n=1 Tax=Rubellimicrobium mesophilum DSM 19309 TaxID=442562 RepID=A0A017HNN0_9RHOB|nr:DUF934 domain-containing protein [Rubellimicrobium mesophilum]EYD75778.1 Oxidoreductase probably involved in sulfite reduction [Rubellimicrobium mesophilum DSM 19309]